VIMAADKLFSGDIKESGHKIAVFGKLGLLVGGAGSVSLTKLASVRLRHELERVEGNPSCSRFDHFMQYEGEDLLRELVFRHADVVRVDSFAMLVAFSDSAEVRLYQVQADGIPYRIDDNPGYGCIGRGYALGGAVLLRQFYTQGLRQFRAARLASYMIMAVHTVDMTVGEDPEIFQTDGGSARRFHDRLQEVVKDRVTARAGSLHSLWKFLDDKDAEFEGLVSQSLQDNMFLRKFEKLLRSGTSTK
jgi:hypothetical protein